MTPAQYLQTLEANLNLDSDSWFDGSGEDLPDDFQYSGEAAIEQESRPLGIIMIEVFLTSCL